MRTASAVEPCTAPRGHRIHRRSWRYWAGQHAASAPSRSGQWSGPAQPGGDDLAGDCWVEDREVVGTLGVVGGHLVPAVGQGGCEVLGECDRDHVVSRAVHEKGGHLRSLVGVGGRVALVPRGRVVAVRAEERLGDGGEGLGDVVRTRDPDERIGGCGLIRALRAGEVIRPGLPGPPYWHPRSVRRARPATRPALGLRRRRRRTRTPHPPQAPGSTPRSPRCGRPS